MLKVHVGNLFDSKAQTLVNTVNCVGVMGKGIALEFRKRFPEYFDDYAKRCAKGEVLLGRPYLYIFGTGKIMDQVWSGINSAKVLVAELTGKNPNVFYDWVWLTPCRNRSC